MSGTPTERFGALLEHATDSAEQPFMRVLMLLALERSGSEQSMEVIRRVRRSTEGGFRKAFSEIFSSSQDDDARAFADDLATFALAASDGIFLARQIERDVEVGILLSFLRTSFLALGVEFMARHDEASVRSS